MDKLTKIMLWLFIVPAAADIMTTAIAMLRAGHSLGETNPIFLLVGNVYMSFAITIILHLLVIFVMVRYNERSAPAWRFLILSAMVWIALVRVLVVITAAHNIAEPVAVETAQASALYEPAAKATHYSSLIIGAYALPMLLTMLIYYLFTRQYHVQNKQGRML